MGKVQNFTNMDGQASTALVREPIDDGGDNLKDGNLIAPKISAKSSWGGKRNGAGRKSNPNSLRAWSKKAAMSPYKLKRAWLVSDLAPKIAPDVYEEVKAGRITVTKAVKILRRRLLERGEVLLANSYDRKLVAQMKLMSDLMSKERI